MKSFANKPATYTTVGPSRPGKFMMNAMNKNNFGQGSENKNINQRVTPSMINSSDRFSKLAGIG
jgi:hypothetical protein